MKPQQVLVSGAAVLGAVSSGQSSAEHREINLRHAGWSSSIGLPILDSFVSYSIEFASFPDFAGNKSSPNAFSETLIGNIGAAQGSQPIVRVGGNTQDYAIYNASLDVALVGVVDPARSPDYPTTIHIGPSFFESYSAWSSTPGIRYVHGFNMGLGGNRSDGWQTLLDTVPLACRALGDGNRFYAWEYGNEPDSYSRSSQGPVRPDSWWNETAFVGQWLNGTRQILKSLQQHCPGMAASSEYGYMAPSFAGTGNKLQAPLTWHSGLDADKNVRIFSSHNYISGAASPGVTLQGTLLNHSVTVQSVEKHVVEYKQAFGDSTDVPHVLGEANSLYNQGKPGLSNTFGAALWGLDFNLYCASVGIRRVHMHMGTNYRYGSWQPVQTNLTAVGTKPPYYGNMATASMLSRVGLGPSQSVSVAHIPLPGTDGHEAAYAAFRINAADGGGATTESQDTHPARIMVINMAAYNTTEGGEGVEPVPEPDLPPRGYRSYTFRLWDAEEEQSRSQYDVVVRRLYANGSDAIKGVTWDGYSFERELNGGRPVRLPNVTFGDGQAAEVVTIRDGSVTVVVPDSSAAMLIFPAN